MDPTGIVIGAGGLVMVGVVVFLTTRAAAGGTIEVNPVLGLRTALTTSSQRAWLVAHRAALPLARLSCVLAVLGAALSAVGQVLVEVADVSPAVPVLALGAGYLGCLVAVVLAARAGDRAVRSLPPDVGDVA